MNIKTINQLEETNNIDGFYGIACDENGNAKKYELPSLIVGEGNNSVMLDGGDNQVISESSVALGENNLVGLKGWYYKALDINTSSKTIDVYLTKKQTIPVSGKPSSIETDIAFNLIVGDTISIVNDNKHDNKFTVISVQLNNGFVRIKAKDDLPFTTLKQELILDPEDYSIYCLSKPDAGISDIGQGSFAAGYDNKTTNGKSTAFGYNNHAYGKFSFVEGRDNEAGYAAHAEGRDNVASGEQSHAEGKYNKALGNNSHVEGNSNIANDYSAHAEGYGSVVSSDINHEPTINDSAANAAYSHAEGNGTVVRNHSAHAEGRGTIVLGNSAHAEGLKTQANANASHAEGNKTISNGSSSHAEGLSTITNNIAEHAQGKYNKSNEDTLHSVGIGTSDTARKNAHEIMNDGKHYIYGIGGYDGTNAVTANAQGIIAKSVQEVINELVDIINQIG